MCDVQEEMKSGNTLSDKEKVPGAVVSKEDHADSFVGHNRTHHYWLPCKKVQL